MRVNAGSPALYENRRPHRPRIGYRRRQANAQCPGWTSPGLNSRAVKPSPDSTQTIAAVAACWASLLDGRSDQRGQASARNFAAAGHRRRSGPASPATFSGRRGPHLEVQACGERSLPLLPASGSSSVRTVRAHPSGLRTLPQPVAAPLRWPCGGVHGGVFRLPGVWAVIAARPLRLFNLATNALIRSRSTLRGSRVHLELVGMAVWIAKSVA